MKKVGRIWGAEIHGDVFESKAGRFHYTCEVMYRDSNSDERWRSDKSDEFSSLEALIASLPSPRLFHRNGDQTIDPAELAALAKRGKERIERLRR